MFLVFTASSLCHSRALAPHGFVPLLEFRVHVLDVKFLGQSQLLLMWEEETGPHWASLLAMGTGIAGCTWELLACCHFVTLLP